MKNTIILTAGKNLNAAHNANTARSRRCLNAMLHVRSA
jgi:hypothetical protein